MHENFILWLSFAPNTCTEQVVTRRYTFYFTKKKLKLKKKKNAFLPSLPKAKV